MPEDEYGAVFNVQRHERFLKLPARFILGVLGFRALDLKTEVAVEEDGPLFPLDKIDRFVDGNFIEPTEDRVRGIVRVYIFVYLEKCRLRDIHGVLVIVYDPESDIEHCFCIFFDHRLKSISVYPCGLHRVLFFQSAKSTSEPLKSWYDLPVY